MIKNQAKTDHFLVIRFYFSFLLHALHQAIDSLNQ